MASTIAGALVGKALGAYGSKTEIPQLANIDPAAIQALTVGGNLSVLPQAQALASAVNRGNAAQLRTILNRGGQLDLAESVVGSQLRGELPSDVQRQLSDSVAAQAAGLGLPGTGFQVGIGGLRGVLSSLQLQQQGLANFGALSQLTTPQLMGPEAMFFSPQQRLEFAFRDRSARFQRDLLTAQIAAAPDPADVALAEGFDNFFETWKNVGMGALGGMGGGGMMGGGGGGGGKGPDNRFPSGTPQGGVENTYDFGAPGGYGAWGPYNSSNIYTR